MIYAERVKEKRILQLSKREDSPIVFTEDRLGKTKALESH
jgi:hypothetical protein